MLLSLAEALLWGRIVSLLSSGFRLGLTWESAFIIILISHLLGQWVTWIALKRGAGSFTGPGAARCTDRDSDRSSPILDEGSEVSGRTAWGGVRRSGSASRCNLLLAWAGVLIGICGCLGIVWRNEGYVNSWFYTGIAVSVLASAAGVNSVTKRLDSQGARRKLVVGSILFFFMALSRPLPETAVLRDTILYLSILSVFLIRQRGYEISGPSVISKKRQWSLGSLITVSVVMVFAIVFSLGSSVGRELISQLSEKLWPVLETILEYVLLPVGYLVQWIGMFLQKFIKPDDSDFDVEFESFRENMRKMQESKDGLWTMPVWLKWLLAGSVIAGCLVVLWMFISRTLEKAEERSVDESRVSLVSSGVVKEWLDLTLEEGKQKFRKSLQKLRGLFPLADPGSLEELYAGTTEFMSKKGFPRHLTLTPLEYLSVIESQISSSEISAYLRTISVLFSQCYYAGRKPEGTEWELLLSAYHSLLKYEEWPAGDEPLWNDDVS